MKDLLVSASVIGAIHHDVRFDKEGVDAGWALRIAGRKIYGEDAAGNIEICAGNTQAAGINAHAFRDGAVKTVGKDFNLSRFRSGGVAPGIRGGVIEQVRMDNGVDAIGNDEVLICLPEDETDPFDEKLAVRGPGLEGFGRMYKLLNFIEDALVGFYDHFGRAVSPIEFEMSFGHARAIGLRIQGVGASAFEKGL